MALTPADVDRATATGDWASLTMLGPCPLCEGENAFDCGCTASSLRAWARGASSPASAPAPDLTPADGAALANQGASRYNAGKPPLHLLPPDALVMVARVLEFGAEKYSPRGWEKGELSWSDCCRAILAHTWRVLGGQWLDPESGCPHVAHIACNALFVCAMAARGIGKHDVEGVDRVTFDAWQQTPEQFDAIAKVRAKKAAVTASLERNL